MTDALRSTIQTRAAHCCEYCQTQEAFSHDPFSAEHILPAAKGGADTLDNLAWSCLGCNFHKFTAIVAIDLVTEDMAPLFNPRKDSWDVHFRWDEEFTLIIGLTPSGRATVTRLKLNRVGIVNMRQVLAMADKHPPNKSK